MSDSGNFHRLLRLGVNAKSQETQRHEQDASCANIDSRQIARRNMSNKFLHFLGLQRSRKFGGIF